MMIRKMVSMLLFVCMVINLIPVIASADSGAVSQPAAVRALVLKQGFSADIAEALAKLAAKRDDAMKPGIKGELIFTVAPLEIKDVNDALRTITARPELLPKRTFEELSGVPQVTVENLSKVINALFDPADLPQWLRGEKGEELSAERLKSEAAHINELRNRIVKLELDKLEKDEGQQGIESFLEMFNHYKDRVIYPNREVFRDIFRKLIMVCKTKIIVSRSSSAGLLLSLKQTKADYLNSILILTEGGELPPGGLVVSSGYDYPGNAALEIKPDSRHSIRLVLNDRQRAGHLGADDVRRVSLDDIVTGISNRFAGDAEMMELKKGAEEARKGRLVLEERLKKAEERVKKLDELNAFEGQAEEVKNRLTENLKLYIKAESGGERRRLEQIIRADLKLFDEIYVRSKSFPDPRAAELLNMYKKIISALLSRAGLLK